MYQTKRLNLIPFTSEDAYDETYRSWFNDQEVTKYNSHGLFYYDQKDFDAFVKGLGSERLVLKIIARHPFTEPNNEDHPERTYMKHTWIGNISLQSFSWINRSAEFAIVIGEKEFWNKGYATEALVPLLEHGFNKMNLNRIWTGTAATNIGMQTVAQKLGMKYEGDSRQGMFLEGEYIDVLHYGILKEEWNERKEKA